MSILKHPSIKSYFEMSREPKDALVNIILPHNTSYVVAMRKVNQIFNHSGSGNRSELQLFDEEFHRELIEEEITPVVSKADELIKLVILVINDNLKELEKRRSPNRLKALLVKFISVGMYYEYENLYIPQSFKDEIEYFRDYPDTLKDYHIEVASKLREINSESPLASQLEEIGNVLLLMEVSNISVINSVSNHEREEFLKHREKLRNSILPPVKIVREKLNLASSTYNENLTRSMTDLLELLDDEALMNQFKHLVIK